MSLLINAPLAPKLDTLQHERDFTQIKAWMNHWPTISSEIGKINFLLMLKSRRDANNDLHASMALKDLTAMWLDEKFIP